MVIPNFKFDAFACHLWIVKIAVKVNNPGLKKEPNLKWQQLGGERIQFLSLSAKQGKKVKDLRLDEEAEETSCHAAAGKQGMLTFVSLSIGCVEPRRQSVSQAVRTQRALKNSHLPPQHHLWTCKNKPKKSNQIEWKPAVSHPITSNRAGCRASRRPPQLRCSSLPAPRPRPAIILFINNVHNCWLNSGVVREDSGHGVRLLERDGNNKRTGQRCTWSPLARSTESRAAACDSFPTPTPPSSVTLLQRSHHPPDLPCVRACPRSIWSWGACREAPSFFYPPVKLSCFLYTSERNQTEFGFGQTWRAFNNQIRLTFYFLLGMWVGAWSVSKGWDKNKSKFLCNPE